ncbi:hypothetical protein Vretimale_4644, partial [Volvox reticuliferus]
PSPPPVPSPPPRPPPSPPPVPSPPPPVPSPPPRPPPSPPPVPSPPPSPQPRPPPIPSPSPWPPQPPFFPPLSPPTPSPSPPVSPLPPGPTPNQPKPPPPSTSSNSTSTPTPSPAWNNFAGTVRAYSYMGQVNVSSNPVASALPHIVDGDDNTQWQSDACLPTGYTARPSMNPLLFLCNGSSPTGAPPSYCTASNGSSNLGAATDTSVYTGAGIALDRTRAPAADAAFFAVIVPGGPRVVTRVSCKGFSTSNVTVWLIVQPAGLSTQQRVQVSTFVPSVDNYNWIHVAGSWQDVVGLRLQSNASFTLTEVAVQSGPCLEQAVVDMGSLREVGTLRFRYWSPDAEHSNMSVSADGVNWTDMRTFMDPTLLAAVEIYLPEIIYIRYMRISHKVKEDGDFRKVYVWGIDAYDKYGRWGAPPAPAPQPLSLRAMLGVNGIWGWGFNKYSDTLRKDNKGPNMYTAVASWARSYHNMHWDVSWPTHSPKYNTMATTGTDGMWWLNWDREYAAWKAAGLKVDATFQFVSDVFPQSTWGANVTDTAYKLGYAFGFHFGPGRAPPNCSLDAIEVGNEPWIGYNATFYQSVIRGFARGVKDADPTFRLLPCALQADNPYGEDKNNGNFVGARIPPEVAPLLDVVNIHAYSWYRPPDLNGTMIGVHPEHPGSTMNAINNMINWRNYNMPGKPLWVTEWGWDAHLPGETCTTTLCVTQHAQAVYGVRGLMIMARKGVQVADWFFYANADGGSGVFERSGLRGSNATSFPALPVYYSLSSLMQLVGSCGFLGIIAERSDVYAYLLGPPNGTTSSPAAATHLIAWRPVAAGEGPDEPVVEASLTLNRTPAQAWTISGAGSIPVTLSSVVQTAAGTSNWTLQVSAVPLLVQLM